MAEFDRITQELRYTQTMIGIDGKYPVRKVLFDWRERCVRKLRNSLPPDFTVPLLGIIRERSKTNRACLQPLSPAELERLLFKQDYNGRLWYRFVNDRKPIQPQIFGRAIVLAWENGWLGFWQMVSILTWIREYEATNTVLRKFLKRLCKRKPPKSATDQSVRLRKAFEDYVTQEAIDGQVRKSVDDDAAIVLKRLDRLPMDPELKDWSRHILTTDPSEL